MKTAQRIPQSAIRIPRSAFTLVEMLVVITIIGMLAALIIPAVMGGLDASRRGAIVMEISSIDAAMKHYKNTYGSFPPNFSDPAAVVRHLKKAFPRISSSELDHARRLSGFAPLSGTLPALPSPLYGAEALVFWLGGFSNDPEFPLTGQGGPLYVPSGFSPGDEVDNRDERSGLFEFDKSRFTLSEDAAGHRHFEITDINGDDYDIELLAYHPTNLEEPYVYFDTSRGKFGDTSYDEATHWPVFRSNDGNGIVRALVKTNAGGIPEFVNSDSFQILAPGTDDTWSLDPSDPDWNWDATTSFSSGYGIPPRFGEETYTGDMADNLSNFATGAFEDAGEN